MILFLDLLYVGLHSKRSSKYRYIICTVSKVIIPSINSTWPLCVFSCGADIS